MSVKLMTIAWDSPAKGNDLLILLAMCDFSSDEGVCYPSKSTVAKKAKVGATTCKHIMGAYEDIGLWKSEKRLRENGSSSSNIYTINIEMLKNIDYEAFKIAFQKRKKYIPKKDKKSHCDPHKKSHIVTPLKSHCDPLKSHCDPLEPSYITVNTLTISKNERGNDIDFRKFIHDLRNKVPSEYKLKIKDISFDKANTSFEEIEKNNLAYKAYLDIIKTEKVSKIVENYIRHIEAEQENKNGRYVKGLVSFLLSYEKVKESLNSKEELKPIAIDYGQGGIRDYKTDKELLSFMQYQDIKNKYLIISVEQLDEELAKRQGIVAW